MLNSIFVQIANYRDPESPFTIDDLFTKAAHPELITIGVCWQHFANDPFPYFTDKSYINQIKITEVDAHKTQGVCWARWLTQCMLTDEKYTLMIDSHMRFVKNWDLLMIDELKKCPSKKPLLSCLPASYTPPNNLNVHAKPSITKPDAFNEAGDIRCSGVMMSKELDNPVRGSFISGGFMFSLSTVVKEVPYDPYMYFNQEEMSYSIRLWTHGWDVYHPSKVLLYHYYAPPNRSTHWQDNPDWIKFQTRGLQRFNFLTKYKTDVDKDAIQEIERFGLGTERSLESFEQFCGVDFKNKYLKI